MSRVPKVKWFRCMFKCQGRCWYCGARANTIDHAKPRSRHGKNLDYNLLPACWECNNEKGDLTVSEFRRVVRLKIAWRMLNLGYHPRDIARVVVTFYGEGNLAPWAFQDTVDQ